MTEITNCNHDWVENKKDEVRDEDGNTMFIEFYCNDCEFEVVETYELIDRRWRQEERELQNKVRTDEEIITERVGANL